MNVLLHTCCAPCASACVPALRELGHDVTLFFSNANIAPADEYERRLDSVRLLAERLAVPLCVDPARHDEWLREAAAGLEGEPERGARCARCFRYSLCRTRDAALQGGFAGFTTSLTVSPHKRSGSIFDIGRSLDPARFLAVDFKKRDGFKRSLALSAELGLYRQTYCGCEFSLRRAGPVSAPQAD
jgi:predicted adenine nucleotide alpha hydrolase (AANH) superfamily ATPase